MFLVISTPMGRKYYDMTTGRITTVDFINDNIEIFTTDRNDFRVRIYNEPMKKRDAKNMFKGLDEFIAASVSYFTIKK